VMTSFLQEAHDYVYAELHPSPMAKRTEIALEPGSTLYDWHNDIEDEDIDPGTVKALWLIRSSSERVLMEQGIDEGHRSFTTRQYPTRYDTLNGQCEVWPTPDQAYQMTIEYLALQPRFTQDADRPGVPDRLVLLYAIATAKSHYRHPDAQVAGTTFANMLRIEKVKQHENRRYIVGGRQDPFDTVQVSNGVHTFRVR
jgi:hypothetical protein